MVDILTPLDFWEDEMGESASEFEAGSFDYYLIPEFIVEETGKNFFDQIAKFMLATPEAKQSFRKNGYFVLDSLWESGKYEEIEQYRQAEELEEYKDAPFQGRRAYMIQIPQKDRKIWLNPKDEAEKKKKNKPLLLFPGKSEFDEQLKKVQEEVFEAQGSEYRKLYSSWAKKNKLKPIQSLGDISATSNENFYSGFVYFNTFKPKKAEEGVFSEETENKQKKRVDEWKGTKVLIKKNCYVYREKELDFALEQLTKSEAKSLYAFALTKSAPEESEYNGKKTLTMFVDDLILLMRD